MISSNRSYLRKCEVCTLFENKNIENYNKNGVSKNGYG